MCYLWFVGMSAGRYEPCHTHVGTPPTVGSEDPAWGLQFHTANAFTHWVISPAPCPNYYRIQEKSIKPVLLSMLVHGRITSQDTTHFPTWSVVVLWIRMAPIGPYVWIFGSNWWNCLGMTGMYGLDGGGPGSKELAQYPVLSPLSSHSQIKTWVLSGSCCHHGLKVTKTVITN